MKKLCSNCAFKLKALAVLAIVGVLIMLFAIKRGATQEHWVSVGTKTFAVEIADTNQLRTLGLSRRPGLESDTGMLFIFPQPGIYGFWMQDMQFPIDIIWIRQGKVVGMSENLPPPATLPLPVYYPPQPVDQVLEIAAFEATRAGITVGEVVRYSK